MTAIWLMAMLLQSPSSTPTLNLTLAFETAGDIHPDGMLLLGGHLLVSDSKGNQLLVFDRDEKLLERVGSIGTGRREFLRPGTLAAGPEGSVYVAEYGNQRVQILDRRLQFKGMIDLPLPTNSYEDFEVDGEGNLLASRLAKNTIIQRFSADGKQLKGWGAPLLPSRVLGPEAAHLDQTHKVTFNRVQLSRDTNTGNVFACSKFAPLVRKYDSKGNLLWQKTLAGKTLETLIRRFIKGERESLHGIYDGNVASVVMDRCYFDSAGRRLYILFPTAELSVLDEQGNQLESYRLKPSKGPETGTLFIPVGVIAENDWLLFYDIFTKKIWKISGDRIRVR